MQIKVCSKLESDNNFMGVFILTTIKKKKKLDAMIRTCLVLYGLSYFGSDNFVLIDYTERILPDLLYIHVTR